MIEITLKMAQVRDDSPYLPKEVPKVIKDVSPGQPLPTTTPEEDSESMAKQWMGQMTRIGPELYVEDSTASLLSALKALGLPMSSKQDLMTISSLFVDDSVLMDNV